MGRKSFTKPQSKDIQKLNRRFFEISSSSMSQRVGVGRGGNPWKIDNLNKNKRSERQDVNKVEQDKFKTAQREIQASVQRHLQQEYESSSSDEEELNSEQIVSDVVKDYSSCQDIQGLERVQQFLERSFQSGAGICLICIASIKRLDPIWNCIECYGFFHLVCIQKWSRDSVFQQKEAQEDLPQFRRSNKINWACPKCRHEYDQSEVPQKYFCFCGKTQDPPHQPFLVPHSCGERCDKILKPECGHLCLLLCHPGPCPPCPKMVEVHCHCKKRGPKAQRCNKKLWSCGERCGAPLLCKKHFCEDRCHSGDCPSCNKRSTQWCNCGSKKREQPCMTPAWQCDKVCGKAFSCGHHSCAVRCHSGSCGDCPGSRERTCPCGKSNFKLSCTVEVPTCNETCSKLLDCKAHFCSQKCHKSDCGMCREIVVKACRCGNSKKELLCHKEYLCEKKCKRMKSCSRHACNRKCCDSFCPPCEKECGRLLSCGNHKCPAICHRGRCYPCPEVIDITCRCGGSSISVPCGQKKRTKPPQCSAACKIPPTCHHSTSLPHKCHFGSCPPCTQICGKARKACSHRCPAECHSAVWQEVTKNPDKAPTGPWEVTEPQMKRCNLPCPDCLVPVPVTCVGGHETSNRPCFESAPKPCSRACGRLLACGNHSCDKQCHAVTGSSDASLAGDNCARCAEPCGRERPEGCSHQCSRPCHPGECPPCESTGKVKCHCGVGFMYIRCSDYSTADVKTKEQMRSCGGICPKNYQCGHQCVSNCHSGDCPDADLCKKKVKVRCPCGRIKKDIPCKTVRKGNVTTVECNELCLSGLADGRKEGDQSTNATAGNLQMSTEGKAESSAEEKNLLLRYWHCFAGALVAVCASVIYLNFTS